jgi:hypothetical protein
VIAYDSGLVDTNLETTRCVQEREAELLSKETKLHEVMQRTEQEAASEGV